MRKPRLLMYGLLGSSIAAALACNASAGAQPSLVPAVSTLPSSSPTQSSSSEPPLIGIEEQVPLSIFQTLSPSVVVFTRSNLLVQIDPTTNEVVASFHGPEVFDPLGGRQAIYTDGSIWMTDPYGDVVHRIDPLGGDSLPIQLPAESHPADLASMKDLIWVACANDTLAVINPATDQVEEILALESGGGGGGGIDDLKRVAAGEGTLWVTNFFGDSSRELAIFDPVTRQMRGYREGGDGTTGIAVGAGAVWISSRFDRTVWRIDPVTWQTTGSVLLPDQLGAMVRNLAVSSDAVWVLGESQVDMYRIDANSLEVAVVAGSFGGSAVAVIGGQVWVASPDFVQAERIDPVTTKLVAVVAVEDTPMGILEGP